MIKYKGTTIFPSAIFEILDRTEQIELYQVEISKDEFKNDKITIVLPLENKTELFEKQLNSLFKSRIRVTPFLRYIPKSELNLKVNIQDKRKQEKIIFL